MFMCAILFLWIGMVLGQRFRMLILAPASLFAFALPLGYGIVRAETVETIALSAATAIVCLQIGYLIGINLRSWLILARASRYRSTSLTGSLPL